MFDTDLRLPWELNDVFQEVFQLHMTDTAERVMARVRAMRGGQNDNKVFQKPARWIGIEPPAT